MVVIAMISIAALGHLDTLLPWAPAPVLVLGKILTYVLMAGAGAAAAATLYRYGPNREKAKWVWLTPGSIAATLLWLLLTFGFGIYVANFGNYDATYGSLGAVIVLLTWLYLSAYVLLMAAELNSEIEHQTARDTTSGADARSAAAGQRPPTRSRARAARTAARLAASRQRQTGEAGADHRPDRGGGHRRRRIDARFARGRRAQLAAARRAPRAAGWR
jgi:membrane protein